MLPVCVHVCKAEITSARVALAGAKVSKTIHYTIPKLDKASSEYKKKKRDAIKSAKDAMKHIGVEEDVPAVIVQQLNAV